MTTPRRFGNTAARFTMNGDVSTGVSWIEDWNFQVNGSFLASATTFTWQLNIRETEGDSSAIASFTTTDGDLTITNSSTATNIAISVTSDDISALDGDYIVDIAYEDGSSNRYHWAHGTLTFHNEPVWAS